MVKFQINRLSTNEKLAALLVLGIGGYFTYEWYQKKKGSGVGTSNYVPSAKPVPSAPSASPGIQPANLTVAAQNGSLGYVVTTTDVGDAGRLNVRSAPDASSVPVGFLEHGSTAASDGLIQGGFAHIVDNSGTAIGWASLAYLTPVKGTTLA
jgi:hypothetical protein